MKLGHTLMASLIAAALAPCFGTARAEDKTDCALVYTRTACAGQEAESFKKCDGKKSCTNYVAADSAEKCAEAAVAACSNDRLNVTASKNVSATYKGKALKSKGGKEDLCLDYAKRDAEFNQCSKK
jgi:single-stranded DNA-specific DHH superfamily exonuclease